MAVTKMQVPSERHSDDSPSRRVLDLSVGENLDRLMTMDMRGDQVGQVIYKAARAQSQLPLSLAGAHLLSSRLEQGSTILVLTGFCIPPSGVPETDGLIGSALMAYAVARAWGAVPVFVCEPTVVPALSAAIRATGLATVDELRTARDRHYTVAVLPWPGSGNTVTNVDRTVTNVAPAVCLALERPGPNPQGRYHFADGTRVSTDIAPLETLYEEVASRGVATLAIGDFGNELGMGAIADTVRTETIAGGNCGCGCGGGSACSIVADVTLACSVSDWGSYALAAALSHLQADPALLVDSATYQRVLQATTAAGAIDGTSRLAIPHIDGIGDDYNTRLLEMMRDVVAYPNRPHLDNAMRRYRATRIY